MLAGCAEEPETGLLVAVEGFAGLAAADAPNATVVGREVLGLNGTAVDAAVAMGFAMAVTMPSRVGLGGGGACLIWSEGDRFAEALVFAPVRGADGAIPPLLARAMALLHARYGTQNWGELLAPAENLARFGFLPSRAFLRDLEAARGKIGAAPELAALFRGSEGRPAGEGVRLRNVELSTVLGGLRTQGGGYLHQPSIARRYAEAAGAGGMPIAPETVRDALPEFLAPVEVPAGDAVLYLPPPRSSAGIAAGQMWRLLERSGDDPAAIAEAGLKALAAQRVWIGPDGLPVAPPEVLVGEESIREMAGAPPPPPVSVRDTPFTAGFVVGDRLGNAVACSFTLNDLFGRGRLARGLGVVLPAEPAPGANNSVPLALGLVASPSSGAMRHAAQAGGGEAAFQHLVQVLLALREGADARAALEAPRLVWQQGQLVVESGIEAAALGNLPQRRGPDVGLALAFTCPAGLRNDAERACSVAADPRGFGLAERAQ